MGGQGVRKLVVMVKRLQLLFLSAGGRVGLFLFLCLFVFFFSFFFLASTFVNLCAIIMALYILICYKQGVLLVGMFVWGCGGLRNHHVQGTNYPRP